MSWEGSREYRVRVAVRRSSGGVDTITRQEGPWHKRAPAEAFAAQFTPPKFERAWVESRTVFQWAAV